MKRTAVVLAMIIGIGRFFPGLSAPAAAGSRYESVLKSPAGREKLIALARMEETGTIDAAVLKTLAADEEPLIRARCAELLGRNGNPAGVPLLATLCDDSNNLVARTAVYSLGLIGGTSALEPLKRCLGEKGPTIKTYALESLGKTGTKEAVPIIAPWLRNFDSGLRAQAALALAFTGDSAAAAECNAIIHDPDARVMASAAYAMGRLGYHSGIDRIAELLGHESAEVRFRAVEALGRLKAESAVPLIAPLTRDADRWVAIKAAETLGRIGSNKGAPALEALLASNDDYLRTLALEGLAVIGGKKQFEAVKPLIHDRSLMVRRAALGAAAKTGKDGARPLLLKTVKNGARRERSTALEFLGTLGDPDDLALLVQALTPGIDPLVREGAAAGLGNWKGKTDLGASSGYRDDSGVTLTPIEALQRAATGDDWVVASIAIESLGKVGPVDIVPDLVHVYDSSASYNDGDRKLAVVEAIGSMARKIDANDVQKFGLKEFFARAAVDADPRIASAAARVASGFGMKLEAASTGVWQRGATPWKEPALPLGEVTIRVSTSRGDIEILLYGDEAPAAVRSILALAQAGFYDGSVFHRIVPGFVIQGGCPRGDGWGDAGFLLRNEINGYRYERGTVGMADSGKDTAGSQFFITHTPQPHLNGRYTIVGRVTKGMEVVDTIEEGDTFSIRVVE
ncbi:MAG: HEAT repeat domain-containing protein [Candidatus Krumholzibacteriia bacterium]